MRFNTIHLLRGLSIGVLGTSACWTYAEVEEDSRFWFNLTMEGKLAKESRIDWYAELQPRLKEEGREHDQPSSGRPSTTGFQTAEASGWIMPTSGTHTAQGTNHEQRWWQQFMYTFPPTSNGIVITSRTRLEQRNFDTSHDTGHRVRQLVRAIKNIEGTESLSWLLWDELFVSTSSTDWGAMSGFDQNRAFAGIAWQARKMPGSRSAMPTNMSADMSSTA